MGWSLAGFTPDRGKNRRAPEVSPKTLDWAKQAAQHVAESCGVKRIDRATLDAWRKDERRTLYVFDVRDPAEYETGHIPGVRSAPGGQLVQATDQFVGTFGARIVLVDDAEVRAAMTASWLRQMGYTDVFVLVERGTESGWPVPPLLEADTPRDATRDVTRDAIRDATSGAAIDCTGLSGLLARHAATVVDLSLSRDYLREHIPGAWFAIRTRLARAFKKIPHDGTLVLTSEDGVLAGMAVVEARALTDRPVRTLAGGNAAWRAAGHPFSAEAKMADEAVDQWRKPYERSGNTKAMMQEYLDWEVDLLPRLKRDGSLQFDRFRPRPPAATR
jgi:rhodanese-related sulfurtransferase